MALGDLVVAGQELDGAIEAPRFFQRAHEPRLRIEELVGADSRDRQGLRLVVVVR